MKSDLEALAIDEIAEKEAKKIVAHPNHKILKDICKGYLLPVGIGATIGSFTDLETAINLASQVGATFLPGLFLQLWTYRSMTSIDTQYKKIKKEIQTNQLLHRSQLLYSISALAGIGLSYIISYGLSYIPEIFMNVDNVLVAGISTLACVGNTTLQHIKDSKTNKEIEKIVEEESEKLDEKGSNEMNIEDIEKLVDYGFTPNNELREINGKTYRRRFGDSAPDWLKFFDNIGERGRDKSALCPNIKLSFKEGEKFTSEKNNKEYFSRYIPNFRINLDRTKTKKEICLRVAEILYSYNQDIAIHPMFEESKIEDLVNKTYDQLWKFEINSKDISLEYTFNPDSEDEIDIQIKSRDKLFLVNKIFNYLSGRNINDRDFDSEIVQKSQKFDGEKLNFAPLELDSWSKEVSKKPEYEIQGKSIPNPKELSNIVAQIFEENKNKSVECDIDGKLAVNIDGVLYEFNHLIERQTRKSSRIIALLTHPIRTIKSYLSNGFSFADLRSVDVWAQEEGINSSNICSIAFKLSKEFKSLKFDPRVETLNYEELLKLEDGKKIFEKVYLLEAFDSNGVRLMFNYG